MLHSLFVFTKNLKQKIDKKTKRCWHHLKPPDSNIFCYSNIIIMAEKNNNSILGLLQSILERKGFRRSCQAAWLSPESKARLSHYSSCLRNTWLAAADSQWSDKAACWVQHALFLQSWLAQGWSADKDIFSRLNNMLAHWERPVEQAWICIYWLMNQCSFWWRRKGS